MTATNGHVAPPKDRITLDRLETLVGNAMLMRSELIAKLMDPRRSIDDDCGYLQNPTARDFQALYDREPVAARAVELLPKESWQVQPLIYETEDETPTPFEEAWDGLGSNMYSEESHHLEERGSVIFEYMLRADILSGIGQYGVILLGIDDGKELSLPVDGWSDEEQKAKRKKKQQDGNGSNGKKREPPADADGMGRAGQYYAVNALPQFIPGRGPAAEDETDGPQRLPARDVQQDLDARQGEDDEKIMAAKERGLLYVRVFPESLAQVTQWENDPQSPRFGQPKAYLLTFNDQAAQQSGMGVPVTTLDVHWSRCIHVCDLSHQAASSEVLAVPRLRPILNAVLDLKKIYGADGEGYWRGGFPGLSLETHPQLGGEVDIDRVEVRGMMEQYMNTLQRYIVLSGMSAKSLAPQVVDPTPHVAAQIERICIKIGCPVRVFKGSERGELASSQDDAAWNDRLKERQKNYITPRIVVPTVNRLINLGCLPKPSKSADEIVENARRRGWRVTRTRNGLITLNKVSFVKDEETGQETDEPQTDPKTGEPVEREAQVSKGGFCVEWPDISSQTKAEKATVAATMVTALAGYVSGGVEAIIPPKDFLTKVVGMDDEEVDAMLDEAAQAEEEKLAEQQALAEEQGFEMAPPEGMVDPDQQDRDHEVALEQAKSGGGAPPPFGKKPGAPPFGGKPGGGKPNPFGKKPGGKPMPFAANADWDYLTNVELADAVLNAFCATGEGGGVDPSCSPGAGGSGKEGKEGKAIAKQVSEHFGHLFGGHGADKRAFVWKTEHEDKIVYIQPVGHTGSVDATAATHRNVNLTKEAADAFEKANPDWNVVVRDPQATHNAEDDEGITWITISGNPVPIKDGTFQAGPFKGQKYEGRGDRSDPKDPNADRWDLGSGEARGRIGSQLDNMHANLDDLQDFSRVFMGHGNLMENGPVGGLAKLGVGAIKLGAKLGGKAFMMLVRGVTQMHSHGPNLATVANAAAGEDLVRQALALCDTKKKRRKLLDGIKAAHEHAGTLNAFCPTGPGGGVDPSCSSGGGSGVLTTPGGTSYEFESNAVADSSLGRLAIHGIDRGSKSKSFDIGELTLADGGVAPLKLDTSSGGSTGRVSLVTRVDGKKMIIAKFPDDQKLRSAIEHIAHDVLQDGSKVHITFKMGPSANAFCPTGEGGGIDASCSPGGIAAGPATPASVKDGYERVSGMKPDEVKALIASVDGLKGKDVQVTWQAMGFSTKGTKDKIKMYIKERYGGTLRASWGDKPTTPMSTPPAPRAES